MKSGQVILFPVGAIAFSFIAFLFPSHFAALKPTIFPLLAIVMFCMGMTLTLEDFTLTAKKPAIIGITVLIQYLFMPFFAWVIALAFCLSPELTAGMVLVGSSAGGTASNVICYLAGGRVALSILMTLVSTLCAVLLMPMLTWLYLNQTVQVPVWEMMKSIFLIVLAPVVAGTIINSLFRNFLLKLQNFFPVLSGFSIIMIIAIIVGLNHHNLQEISIPVIAAVILHNFSGLATGYLIPKFMKYDPATCRTVSIEVGMQNSGLSVALAIKYFSGVAALPGAIFSIWHNISGSLLAAYWRKN